MKVMAENPTMTAKRLRGVRVSWQGMQKSLQGLTGRLLWLALLLFHLPTVIGLFEAGGNDRIRLVALLLSQIFFALKVADVRFLRLPKSRRVRAALFICVALLHADVVQRYAQAGGWPDIEPVTWVILSSVPVVLLAAGERTLPRRLHMLATALLRRWQRALQTCDCWLADLSFPMHQPALIRISLPHRAPPFPASY